jgi:DNA-binding beta-propeller fold protein YncE
VIHVVLDCREPEALAEFWAFALEYRVAHAEGAFISLDNTLRRVDLRTLKASVIPTGRTPVAITAAGGFIWVANRGDKTVWKFSADSGQAVKQIDMPGIPTSIAAGDGAIWVTLWPRNPPA